MHTIDIKLYFLPALLIVVGVLFIVRWRFYAKGYKKKIRKRVMFTEKKQNFRFGIENLCDLEYPKNNSLEESNRE